MAKFQIIFLSFVLSILSPIISKAQQQESATKNISIFTENSGKYLYRAKINYKDKVLSGMLIIRKSDSNTYRVAMVTEMGMKIFEMEFFPNKTEPFILHSCIKYLDKNIIINTLRRDFESIFLNFANWKHAKIINTKNGITYRYNYEGKRDYLCNNYGDVSKIIRRKWFVKQEIISIENIKNPYPKTISIEHQHTRLSIQLHFIK
jgi:hypothetical protein